MAATKGLKLVDFGNSLFWTLAGVISVGCTITAVNQRVRAQVRPRSVVQNAESVVEAGRSGWSSGLRGLAPSGSAALRPLPPLPPPARSASARRAATPPAHSAQEEHLDLLRRRNAVMGELVR
jgi:hypothetical protein